MVELDPGDSVDNGARSLTQIMSKPSSLATLTAHLRMANGSHD